MSNKNLFAAATLIGCAVVVLAHAATADAATSKKAKPVSKSPAAKVMMCEGTAANIVSNSYAGTGRSETNIAFGARINPAKSEIAIMGVQGSKNIKAGRHLIERDGTDYVVQMPWVDSNNVPQTLVIRFDREGNFSGTTQESMASNAGISLLCGFMPSYCDAVQYTIVHEYKGVCWESN